MAGVVTVFRRLLDAVQSWFDPTGRPSKEYFLYMRDLDAKVRELEARIAALEP
jgi:hypothetical protein